MAARSFRAKRQNPYCWQRLKQDPNIRPQEASEVLSNLTESDDDDNRQAVHEALAALNHSADVNSSRGWYNGDPYATLQAEDRI
jgi:hypothetical protein